MNNSGSIKISSVKIGTTKIGTIKIVDCQIFNKFPEIIFGISTKTGLSRNKPYRFNMSFNVGDKPENVLENKLKYQNFALMKFCTYESSDLFYSYRREGEKSGRVLGIIAMRNN